MVVKKFGSQIVYLSVYAPANGYVIDVVFCELQTFGLYRLHTPQLALSKLLGCYMVKPHGQLVLVSSTPHS
ncbi:hypothetical protein, partial [Pseudomonas fragi]|uniref:hypothetical protein n=1 Tax=Pseudomonas fragi TaxID=296 RepID=UPI001C3CF8DF